MAGVADQPDVADAAEAVTAFHDPEAALDRGTDRGDRLVEPALPRLQRLVAGRFVHQAVVDAGVGQSVAPALRGLGLGVTGVRVALDPCAAGWLACRSAEVRIAVRMISEPSSTATCAL